MAEGEGGGGPSVDERAKANVKAQEEAKKGIEDWERQIELSEQALENYKKIAESQQRNSLIAAQQKQIAADKLKIAEKNLEVLLQVKDASEEDLKTAYKKAEQADEDNKNRI